ncbi:hypothetical protein [Mesorhizobium australafricanum]|uniref:hypothetical protein n=1 Tax=Mesorhizobium australafricanum TaxID=3072311 RepID=UPI002A2494DB|nr:hypothetical protein [Mesorhizobium sp. VK9D]
MAGVVLAALALAAPAVVGASPVLAQTSKAQKSAKPQAAKPANIDRNGVLILLRGALLALDQANKTGNYTVLRDIGAPGFQANSAARLAEIFASQRNDQLDLAGVAVLEPQLTLLPQIEPNGMLHMAGFFPSVPMQVNFELLFAPHKRQWKLFGISVSLGKGGPQAPETAPEPVQPPSTETPEPPTPEVSAKPKAEQPGN